MEKHSRPNNILGINHILVLEIISITYQFVLKKSLSLFSLNSNKYFIFLGLFLTNVLINFLFFGTMHSLQFRCIATLETNIYIPIWEMVKARFLSE